MTDLTHSSHILIVKVPLCKSSKKQATSRQKLIIKYYIKIRFSITCNLCLTAFKVLGELSILSKAEGRVNPYK